MLQKDTFKEEGAEPEKEESSEEEVDSSDEEIDPNAPISVGKTIDRTKIKTTSDRNRIRESKAKLAKYTKVNEQKKFMKDIDRLENLVKQNENESRMQKNRVDSRNKATDKEIDLQEKTGIVSIPKKLGRFKYN